jgi:hypothetical protein
MTWLWGCFAAVAALAGIRHWLRARSVRGRGAIPRVDDDAIRHILETGSIRVEDDEPLDLDAAARAEEAFWKESWDEPEEYPR